MDESGIISTQQGRGTYILEIPTPQVSDSIRLKALQDLTQRYITDAERLGASPEELQEVLNRQVTQWKEKRLPVPDANSNTGDKQE
jgi:GntR family transcriptional regulator